MAALIFQRQREFSKSSKYFHYIIKKGFAKEHVRAIKAYKAGAIKRVKVPKKLLVIYYYMGQNYYYLYSDTKQSAYFKASYTYLDIVDQKGNLGSRASKYLASLKAKKKYVAKLEKKWSWYASAGWITWQESITLAEKTNSDNTSKVLASNSGYCVGGGFRYANVRHGFNVNGCGFAGSANLYEKPGASYQYRQNNVPVNGLYLSTGYFYRPMDDKNSIGISLPMFFRQGQYSETDTRKVIGSGTLSAGGIALDAEFEIYKGLSLYTNLASVNSTNLLLMQAKYEF